MISKSEPHSGQVMISPSSSTSSSRSRSVSHSGHNAIFLFPPCRAGRLAQSSNYIWNLCTRLVKFPYEVNCLDSEPILTMDVADLRASFLARRCCPKTCAEGQTSRSSPGTKDYRTSPAGTRPRDSPDHEGCFARAHPKNH